MKYDDVCFRLDSYYLNCESKISTVLSEFSKPANWGEEGFDSAEEIVKHAKEYISELIGCNCLHPIVREDSVVVMDGEEVLEIYYGFIPICKDSFDIENVQIEGRSKESLLYYSYGKTDTDEIGCSVPQEIEAFSCEEQEYRCMYMFMETSEIWITLDICGLDSTELYVSVGKEDTIEDVINKVKKEMLFFLNCSELPYS